MIDPRMAAYVSALEFAERQVAATVQRHPDYFPIYTRQGEWFHEGPLWTDWTGGFLAGMMWRFYRRSRDPAWLARAEHYSRLLEPRKLDRNVHDLGFLFLNTYRPWREPDRRPGHRGGGPPGGTARWPGGSCPRVGTCARLSVPQSLFIDIMMNVPLIFSTAEGTGDGDLYELALAHCRTTRDRLVRADGSTAQEGIFDAATGRFLRQSTQQGLSDRSVWARGLAWSLYGFSEVYALTGLAEFLAVSQGDADYWLATPTRRQGSLLGLRRGPRPAASLGPARTVRRRRSRPAGCWTSPGRPIPERAIAYHNAALVMLDVLTGPDYLAREAPGWEGILKHGVYHTRKNLGVNESVMWGDSFLVEALSKVLEGNSPSP